MKDYINIPQDTCYDIPDERDYRYELIFWLQKKYPSKYIMDKWEYQNQWLEEITKYMCVFYSTAHGNNEQNIIEGSKVRIKWKDFWLIASQRNLLDLKRWAKIKSWPDLAKDLKYIKGYSLVQELEEIKDSLVNNKPIVVGTNKGKWIAARKSPYILELGESYGHGFVIIGYDDNYEGWCLIYKNSYWENWWDEGKFYIRYTDFKDILYYSKYSLLDEIDPIIDYKQQVMKKINIPMAKVGFELWIWNWQEAEKPMTREEVVTVVLRTVEKVSKWEITGEKIQELLEELK